MDDCIFCKIVNGSIPSSKVYEDTNYLAFLDVMPATKGHTLVITKKHYSTLIDIPEEELKGLVKIVQNVTKAVIKATNATGYKVEIFNGADSGQSIPHLHFHVIPRYEDDGLIYKDDKNWWTPRKELYDKDEIIKYADEIKKNLQSYPEESA